MPLAPLDPDEEKVWRLLVRLMVLLPREIDDDLARRTGMRLSVYVTLMNLSESPGRRLRMSELAERTSVSPSRMTRIVDALEDEGLVIRTQDPDNYRSQLAQLTSAGNKRLMAAWPAHLAGARALVMDHIAPSELRRLSKVLDRLVLAVEGGPTD